LVRLQVQQIKQGNLQILEKMWQMHSKRRKKPIGKNQIYTNVLLYQHRPIVRNPLKILRQ